MKGNIAFLILLMASGLIFATPFVNFVAADTNPVEYWAVIIAGTYSSAEIQFSAENILEIRQNAIVIYGSSPENVLPYVSPQSMKKAVQDYLKKLDDELKRSELKDLKWLISGVLNTCRTLYTLKTGKITPKTTTAE